MTVKNPKNGLTYEDLFARLIEQDGKVRVDVGNNTYVEFVQGEDDNFIAMTYHETKVVNFLDHNTVQLFDGGWKTTATAQRLDWALLPLGFRLVTRNAKGKGRVRWGDNHDEFKVYSIATGAYRDYTAGMIVERGAF